MAEFDDKLNSLLSNPEAMDQIMKMAQSLPQGRRGADQRRHTAAQYAAPPAALSGGAPAAFAGAEYPCRSMERTPERRPSPARKFLRCGAGAKSGAE